MKRRGKRLEFEPWPSASVKVDDGHDLQLVRQARSEAQKTIKALEQRIEELERERDKANATAKLYRDMLASFPSAITVRREALEEALRLVRGYPAVSTASPEATDIVVGEIAAAIRALMEPKDE
jgi:chromosome segregation ATPase